MVQFQTILNLFNSRMVTVCIQNMYCKCCKYLHLGVNYSLLDTSDISCPPCRRALRIVAWRCVLRRSFGSVLGAVFGLHSESLYWLFSRESCENKEIVWKSLKIVFFFQIFLCFRVRIVWESCENKEILSEDLSMFSHVSHMFLTQIAYMKLHTCTHKKNTWWFSGLAYHWES